MNLLSITLILLSVSLSVLAQILLKQGMSNPVIQSSFSVGLIPGLVAIITNLFIIGGLLFYVSSAAVWLGVLSKIDVSKAYPFVGLGFIGTMFFAYWFLNEPITLTKFLGTIMILIGVILITR